MRADSDAHASIDGCLQRIGTRPPASIVWPQTRRGQLQDVRRDRERRGCGHRPANAYGPRSRYGRRPDALPRPSVHRWRSPRRSADGRCHRAAESSRPVIAPLSSCCRVGIATTPDLARWHRRPCAHRGASGADPARQRRTRRPVPARPHTARSPARLAGQVRWRPVRMSCCKCHAVSAWRGFWPGGTCTYSTGRPCASSTAAIWR